MNAFVHSNALSYRCTLTSLRIILVVSKTEVLNTVWRAGIWILTSYSLFICYIGTHILTTSTFLRSILFLLTLERRNKQSRRGLVQSSTLLFVPYLLVLFPPSFSTTPFLLENFTAGCLVNETFLSFILSLLPYICIYMLLAWYPLL